MHRAPRIVANAQSRSAPTLTTQIEERKKKIPLAAVLTPGLVRTYPTFFVEPQPQHCESGLKPAEYLPGSDFASGAQTRPGTSSAGCLPVPACVHLIWVPRRKSAELHAQRMAPTPDS